MAFTANLHIQGHPKEQDGIRITHCNFTFNQEIERTGQFTSTVQGGIINIGLINENDADLLNWMFSIDTKKSGKIVFSSGITDNQSFQTINFKDALLINYNQTFSEEDEIRVNLTISCRTLDISGVSFVNIWEASE
jgi:hypothetical protein